jgi:hypothetical protein
MRASYPGTGPLLHGRSGHGYQPPPEPEPDELDGEAEGDAAAAALAPFGVMAHHSPPDKLLPFPLVMPAEVSAA